jgi:hypothetical protein
MLNYLDGYFTRLPARYHDKTAMYTTVYIITNEPFEKIYKNVLIDNRESYKAFCRRINKVIEYLYDINGEVKIKKYGRPVSYLRQKKKDKFQEEVSNLIEGKTYHCNLKLEKDWFDERDSLDDVCWNDSSYYKKYYGIEDLEKLAKENEPELTVYDLINQGHGEGDSD